MKRLAVLLALLLGGCATAPRCDTDASCAAWCARNAPNDTTCDGGPTP